MEFVRGKHVSGIVALSNEGVSDFNIVKGGVSAETSDHFVINALLPKLQSFNGVSPCSVVVLASHQYTILVIYCHMLEMQIAWFTFCHFIVQI